MEGVETRRHPSKLSKKYDEGIVQGVVKATQTGILWSQVQVLVGPPEMKIPTFGLVFFINLIANCQFLKLPLDLSGFHYYCTNLGLHDLG